MSTYIFQTYGSLDVSTAASAASTMTITLPDDSIQTTAPMGDVQGQYAPKPAPAPKESRRECGACGRSFASASGLASHEREYHRTSHLK